MSEGKRILHKNLSLRLVSVVKSPKLNREYTKFLSRELHSIVFGGLISKSQQNSNKKNFKKKFRNCLWSVIALAITLIK